MDRQTEGKLIVPLGFASRGLINLGMSSNTSIIIPIIRVKYVGEKL
jgi:hypothetical protein